MNVFSLGACPCEQYLLSVTIFKAISNLLLWKKIYFWMVTNTQLDSLLDWVDIQKEEFNNSWNVEGDQNNKLINKQ